MEPLLTDTSIIRTPLYYGQFNCSLRGRNPDKAYLYESHKSVELQTRSCELENGEERKQDVAHTSEQMSEGTSTQMTIHSNNKLSKRMGAPRISNKINRRR